MKQPSDSKKRIAFPIQLFNESGSGVAAPHEIHVIPTGEWEHWSGAEFEITTDTVAEIIRNFNSGERKSIPITAGHDNGMNGGELPAVGWFNELIDRGARGINAIVEWTDEGKRLLSTKSFKYFSAELAFDYYDLENKKEYGALLVGGALTNRPFFKQLDLDPSFGFSEEERKAAASVLMFSVPDIIKQFNDPTMEINDILTKKPEDLTAEEKAHLVEHKDELTDEQKATFGQALEPDPNPQPDPTPDPAPTPDPTPAPTPTDLSDKSKMITLSAAEVQILRDKADSGQKAFEKLALSERKALIADLTFSEKNQDGRFLPKQEEALEKLLKTFSDEQRTQFTTLVKGIPKAQLFNELGDGGGKGGTAAKEIETAVQEKIKASDGKLTYSQALVLVYSEKPALKARYEEELGEDTK